MPSIVRKVCVSLHFRGDLADQHIQRVYHVKNLTELIRQRSGHVLLKALKDVRRRHRHSLVLHLAAGEPQPPKAWLRQFNHVVDAEQLGNARARLHCFALDHAIFRVHYEEGEDDCRLSFDTLGGSQQFVDTFAEGLEIARECVSSAEWLVLEEKDDILGTRTIRVRQKNLREIRAMGPWKASTCIWVRGDDRKESGGGYSTLCLADFSRASVCRLAAEITAGRPFMARRTGHLEMR